MTDVASGVAGPYRRLFAEPVLRGLVVADICARLPQGMTSLTLLLVVAEHAANSPVLGLSLATATAAAAMASALAGPAPAAMPRQPRFTARPGRGAGGR